MDASESLVPRQVNAGPFLTSYTHAELVHQITRGPVLLPICSLGTPARELAKLGRWVLPPLYHEAMTDELREALVARIRTCFPYHEGSRARSQWTGTLEVVELPRITPPRRPSPRVLAFSVDTAVEQHGPHLPLATDRIQSYAVLQRLAAEMTDVALGPPVDYGQLTWGLPYGFSIDITAALLTRYVTGFANAVTDWFAPAALYVVDVHGSIVHRNAIQEGLRASRCRHHAFRWLYDPLTSFGPDRGDVHAGGIETAVIQAIRSELVDARWWPARIEELAAGQMTAHTAVELSTDLEKFIRYVEAHPLNGIIGSIHNFHQLDGAALLERMVGVARADVEQLLGRTRQERA